VKCRLSALFMRVNTILQPAQHGHFLSLSGRAIEGVDHREPQQALAGNNKLS
jgi:hypothetical protein